MRTIVLEYIYLQNCAIVGVKFQHHGASSWIITCRIQPQAPGWHLMAPGGSWRHAAAKLKWSWGEKNFPLPRGSCGSDFRETAGDESCVQGDAPVTIVISTINHSYWSYKRT